MSLFGLGRSNSLSINTGTNAPASSQQTQSGGLFGSASVNPAQNGGLFGSNNTQNTQAGSLFSSAPATQSQQSGGLLGGLGATASSGGGGLFGATSTSTLSGPAIGGLFGNTAATSAPASGGLFGSTTTTAPSGGLFGTTGASAPSGGLFGAPASSAPSGGLFGTIASSAPSGGLFGGAAPPAAASSSLFRESAAQTAGASQFSSSQAQQTVPGVKIDVSQIRGTTRFADLHEDLKKEIEMIDNFIQKQIRFSDQIDAALPGAASNIATLAPDVALLTSKADGIEVALENDAHATNGLKDVFAVDLEDAKLSFRAVENLKLPPAFHYHSGWQQNAAVSALNAEEQGSGPVDLVTYFTQRTDKLDEQLKQYLDQMAEIEAHLRTMEASAAVEAETFVQRRGGRQINGNGHGENSRVRELAATMRLFEEAIVKVATRVGGAREELVELSVGNGLKNSARNGTPNSKVHPNGWSDSLKRSGSPFGQGRTINGTPNGRRAWS